MDAPTEMRNLRHGKGYWSRGPDLNRGPVDYSRHIVVLVLKAFSLTYHHDTARYSAPIVRKLFANLQSTEKSGIRQSSLPDGTLDKIANGRKVAITFRGDGMGW